jgi:hypothetical protein
VLVDLEADLKVLVDAEAKLKGLAIDAAVLVAADLEVVLKLVAEIQALLAEVEVCLKGLVAIKAGMCSPLHRKTEKIRLDSDLTVSDILVVIGVHLHACLDVINAIASVVVKFALAVVAAVTANVDLHDIVVKISASVDVINTTCGSIAGLLAPVLKLVH